MPEEPGAAADRATARRALTTAVTRSCGAAAPTSPNGRVARRALAVAERRLREAGAHDAADGLAQITDVTTADARAQIRAVMVVLDADANPSVSRASFRAASDGGERL